MKTLSIYISLLFIVLFCQFVSAQDYTGIIIYKKKSDIILNDEGQKNQKTKMFFENLDKVFDEMEFTLKFKNKKAVFFTDGAMALDDKSSKLLFYIGKSIGTSGAKIIYIDVEKNQKLVQKELTGDIFLIKKKWDEYKWELTNEKKQIGNYICYKATTTFETETTRGIINRNVEAWYTTQIPIPFGPDGFGWLPGLILELKVGKFSFYATRINLGTENNIEIIPPNKGIQVTEEEFNKIAREGFERRFK